MVEYTQLSENAKRKLREKFHLQRVDTYTLEDRNILIMEAKELYEYIFLYDIKKYKEAMKLINEIINTKIMENDINKNVQQMLLNRVPNAVELSENIYAYKE